MSSQETASQETERKHADLFYKLLKKYPIKSTGPRDRFSKVRKCKKLKTENGMIKCLKRYSKSKYVGTNGKRLSETTIKKRSKKQSKKRSTKKRSTKKRSTKKRSTKKRSTKKRSTKKRSTKKRSTKKRSTKKRSTKKRSTKKRSTKKRSTKK
jgi:serine/arginine repetitive matrix protein 2